MPFFTNELLNILNTYIPNSVVTVSENDAPWMTEEIKLMIKRKRHIFQRWKRNNSATTKENLNRVQAKITTKIITLKYASTL